MRREYDLKKLKRRPGPVPVDPRAGDNVRFVKQFVDRGFGFPVRLLNVMLVRVRGVWALKILHSQVSKELLRLLATKSWRLTGNEVRFIRQSFEMTPEAFARRFDVSGAAVLKWEKSGDKVTPMHWSMEKDLRLFVLAHSGAKAKVVAMLYRELEKVPESKGSTIEVEASGSDLKRSTKGGIISRPRLLGSA